MSRTRPATTLHRTPRERLLAWVYTGPPGRLWSPVADIAVLWSRWMAAGVRARLKR